MMMMMNGPLCLLIGIVTTVVLALVISATESSTESGLQHNTMMMMMHPRLVNSSQLLERMQNTFPRGRVDKTVFHVKRRLLFVAGLEGTGLQFMRCSSPVRSPYWSAGHHAMFDMFSLCTASLKCKPLSSLTHLLMHFEHDSHLLHGLFSTEDMPHSFWRDVFAAYEYLLQLSSGNVDEEKEDDDDEKEGVLYILGLGFTPHSGMMSYPNYNGVHKALDYPDVHVLASLCELTNIDLRVLVLQRHPASILQSTERRAIGGGIEPKVLQANAAVMYTQLRQIDPRFIYCIQFESLGSLSMHEVHRLGSFLHPILLMNDTITSMLSMVNYSKSMSSSSSSSSSSSVAKVNMTTANHLNKQYQAWMLLSNLHLIDELCLSAQW